MRKLRRATIVATAVLILGVAAAGIGASAALADETGKSNPVSSLVAAIAQKFNLNQADVQKVFDDQRAQMQAQTQAQRQQKLDDRLSQAVTDGKLTQAQADAIKAKIVEFETLKTSLKDKTAAERETARGNFNNSLKQWLTDNKIPEGYLFLGKMGWGHFGFGHFGRR